MSRGQFNKDFKIQVVKQVLEEGKTAAKVGKELELSPNMIARWVKEYNQYGPLPLLTLSTRYKIRIYEIIKLKKSIEELDQEKEIMSRPGILMITP